MTIDIKLIINTRTKNQLIRLDSLGIFYKRIHEMVGAGGAILASFRLRARDLCDQGIFAPFSPDYESGALARLGYPGTQYSPLAAG